VAYGPCGCAPNWGETSVKYQNGSATIKDAKRFITQTSLVWTFDYTMIKRLTKDDPFSWELYPQFEERVRKFAKKYDISCPIEPILLESQQRWVTAPDLAGYFVALDGENYVYAHFSSWIVSNYGQNKLYIYQAEADRNADNFRLLWPQVQDWIK
jgi:hypothetical protein